jgi:hypothetical protein
LVSVADKHTDSRVDEVWAEAWAEARGLIDGWAAAVVGDVSDRTVSAAAIAAAAIAADEAAPGRCAGRCQQQPTSLAAPNTSKASPKLTSISCIGRFGWYYHINYKGISGLQRGIWTIQEFELHLALEPADDLQVHG